MQALVESEGSYAATRPRYQMPAEPDPQWIENLYDDSTHTHDAAAVAIAYMVNSQAVPQRIQQVNQMLQGDWEIPEEQEPMILIVSGSPAESRACAELMGFGQYHHVEHYKDMQKYPRSSVYLYGTGRKRTDYGAIEGLFLMYGHDVIDMNE